MKRRGRAAIVVMLLAGCGSGPRELAVDLRTDLPPGDAFVLVRTELDGHGLRDLPAFRGARFIDGLRVAEFADLEPGDMALHVTLLDASGVPVASRDVSVRFERSTTVTVVIAASCVGVVCPAAGDGPALTTCSGGRCVDPRCTGAPGDPCAMPMCTTDAQCATACTGTLGRCASGECLCPPPCTPSAELCNGADDDCDAMVDEGFDLAADPAHCGSCSNRCDLANATAGCAAGACTVSLCNSGFGDCDGSAPNGCETSLSTSDACGACGASCTGALSLCSVMAGDAMCVSDCPPTAPDLCGSVCTDTATNPRFCGSCMRACTAAHGLPACTGGTCSIASCDSGWGDCDSTASDGCETATSTLTDCGACGVACTRPNATPSCATGTCAIGSCNARFADCNATSADGCETATNTLTNCGSCGVACTRAHATATCTTGVCRIASCDTGWLNLDASDANGCEARACTGVCGDADQNGLVSSGDGALILRIVEGTEMPTRCAPIDGDTLRDGHLSDADAQVVLGIVLSSVGTACIPCTDLCGDVNRNGTVNVVDSLALMTRISAGPPYDACEWWRDDANGTGGVESTDPTRIASYDAGSAVLACPAR